MSVLNPTPQSEAEIAAAKVVKITERISQDLFDNWNRAFDLVWNAPEPQEVLDELGDNARELYELSASMTAYMAETFAGRRDDLIAIIAAKTGALPEVILNSDGTVHIVPQD